MAKAKGALGKKGKRKTHVRCPRCGNFSLHDRDQICAKCGWGKSAKRND